MSKKAPAPAPAPAPPAFDEMVRAAAQIEFELRLELLENKRKIDEVAAEVAPDLQRHRLAAAVATEMRAIARRQGVATHGLDWDWINPRGHGR